MIQSRATGCYATTTQFLRELRSPCGSEGASGSIIDGPGHNAKVTGVTVSPPIHVLAVEPDTVADTLESYRARMTTLAAQRLAKVKEAANAAGVSCEVVHVEHVHPYKAIIDLANTKACDVIVMASHGRRGLSAIVLGSETLKVLTHSTIPVLVYRGSRAGLSSPYFAAS
jgi:nucleotide-binding universal stress UspA family protein